MKKFTKPAPPSETRNKPRTNYDIWRRLIKPTVTLPEPERRRSSVLAVMILLLVISGGVFQISVFASDTRDLRVTYTILIISLLGLFALAFSLNRTGHYQVAAGLIIASTTLGSWASILLNFQSLSSNDMRVSYIAVSVLLCSFLLSTRVTILFAAAQLAVLGMLSFVSPSLKHTNWSSLLGFILFMSLLSIVSNFISRRDLDQIDQQTHQLLESEALLREMSIRDPLTGLFNRRYLDETLDRELGRTKRKQLPLGIIMMDIDHFKRFNDLHGHAAGDLLLQQVGKSLKEHIRVDDIACRYGGEEFMLILPETSQAVTCQRAEHLLAELRQLRIHFQGKIFDELTISLGVAIFPLNGSTKATIMKAADDALYQAKREGRDRIILAT